MFFLTFYWLQSKGKPIARWGRKASGLKRQWAQIAELPARKTRAARLAVIP
jgi:hypothetical protein